METFVNDFSIFFSKIMSCMTIFWNWLSSTVLGEIIIFILLIALFLFLINLIVNFKN